MDLLLPKKYFPPNPSSSSLILQVGNAGLSQSEARAHFSLWNIVMAPLLARNSIIDMDSEVRLIKPGSIIRDDPGWVPVHCWSEWRLYSSLFRAKASGGHSKAQETRDAQFMQKFVGFALIGVTPARPRVCKCPLPQIPVSQSPF